MLTQARAVQANELVRTSDRSICGMFKEIKGGQNVGKKTVRK